MGSSSGTAFPSWPPGWSGAMKRMGDQVVVSGVWDRFSLSVGQFHYQTDGFRANNDLTQDLYNVFAQVRMAPRTSLLAEVRVSDFERGDLPLRFDPANFNPSLRQEDRATSFRLGLWQGFTPNSDLLATVVYQDADFAARDAAAGFESGQDVEAYTRRDPVHRTIPACQSHRRRRLFHRDEWEHFHHHPAVRSVFVGHRGRQYSRQPLSLWACALSRLCDVDARRERRFL